MAKPYSLDLRERVIARVMAGETVRSVAGAFQLSASSVVKWSQHYLATASAAAKPMGGRRHFVLAGQRAWLLERIALDASVTLRGLQAELAARGVTVSYGAVWDFVHAEGLSFKKNRAGERTGSPRRRPSPGTLEAPSRKA